MTIHGLPDGVLEPVVILLELGVVGKGLANGIIQQERLIVHLCFNNCGSDSLRERLGADLSVEDRLGFGGILDSGENAMEPAGDADMSTTIVGDIDNQLLGTRSFEAP